MIKPDEFTEGLVELYKGAAYLNDLTRFQSEDIAKLQAEVKRLGNELAAANRVLEKHYKAKLANDSSK